MPENNTDPLSRAFTVALVAVPPTAMVSFPPANTVVALNAANAEPINDRLTVTRAALTRADRLLLLITGADKRKRLEAGGAPVDALFTPEMPPCEILYAP